MFALISNEMTDFLDKTKFNNVPNIAIYLLGQQNMNKLILFTDVWNIPMFEEPKRWESNFNNGAVWLSTDIQGGVLRVWKEAPRGCLGLTGRVFLILQATDKAVDPHSYTYF